MVLELSTEQFPAVRLFNAAQLRWCGVFLYLFITIVLPTHTCIPTTFETL